jgi:hypothetical protein
MLNGIAGFKDKLLAPYNGLEVTWYDRWHPALDEALQSLPEMETCPHALFRLLIETHGAAQKRVALVTEDGLPVAAVGLRRIGRYRHELVTWVIVPDSVFPARPGYLIPALEALGVEVIVGWRRMDTPPPPSPLIRDYETLLVYQIRCSANFEDYWHTSTSGHWNTIKKCRKRCQGFTFTVNAPSAAEWTIRNWGKTWNMDPILVDDSVMIAEYFEDQGKFYTFLLLDQEKPVAGHTFIPHRKGFVWEHTYRDPTYDSFGAGTRLMDLTFYWAAEAGFETIDLGGRHEYKMRWAPPDGELSIFTICPEPLLRAKQAANWVRTVRRDLVRGGQAQSD